MSKSDPQAADKETSLQSRKARHHLSPEKKFQIFLETQHGDKPAAEILRREGLYSSDLARIRQQVKEGAMERLSARPGKRKEAVSAKDYGALKRELEDKERAMADLTVELAVLRKKTNGGSWDR